MGGTQSSERFTCFERTWRGQSAVHCTWIRWKEQGHHASFVRAMIVCLRYARTAVPEEFGKIQRT